MKEQLVKLSLAIFVALLAGCAKTTLVPLAPTRSDIYKYKMTEKTVYVVLKTGEICELRDFSVSSDSVIVTKLLRNKGGKVIERRASIVAFEDVASIVVTASRDRPWLLAFVGVPLGLALTIFLFALVSS